ncbi:hypothetical protein FB451DRAFT_1478335 [Mycena latifolia]|nr:hypothetical protein FB451DRAFT_1478335 [Mycena latifolia]
MHRALRNPEVLELICRQLFPRRDREPGKDGSRVLARLATTCRDLSEPALDALWSFQNTIFHVLDCMPTGVWKKSDRSLRRPILRTDWERPLLYMHRVRSISLSDSSFSSSSELSQVFEIIRLSLPTQQLFPFLRRLAWVFNKPSSFSHASLFFGPRLTHVVLARLKSIADLTLLSALAIKCPLLRDVKLVQTEICDASQFQTVSSFVGGLTYLQILDLDHLNQSAFDHIALLPDLRILKLGAPLRVNSAIPTPIRLFVALQHLELRSAPSDCVLAFVCTMSHSPLASLLIDVSPPPDVASTAEIYSSLETHLPPAFLEHLSISSMPASSPMWIHQQALRMEDLCPLFHFSNLTQVTLQPPASFNIDDDDVSELADAWPCLEELSLGPVHPLRTTLRSLLSLATHCPRLRTLALSLDASVVPTLDQDAPVRVVQASLTEWEVADSIIASALPVAAFLSSVFPALDAVCADMQDTDSHEDGVADALKELWAEVDEALPVCHAMRDEEQHWAKQAYNSRCRSESLEV